MAKLSSKQLNTKLTGSYTFSGSAHKFIGNQTISGSVFLTGSNHISGTIKVNSEGVYSSSTAIFTNNITNGYPTSNPWGTNLAGSYFNNFDNTTNVSEILRFMSGVISHSLDVADASANTKTFASVDLPAPFSPSSACTVPLVKFKLTSLSACTPGKAFDTLLIKSWLLILIPSFPHFDVQFCVCAIH